MTCGGCSGAVTRVLSSEKAKQDGVESFNVDLPTKMVYVEGTISYDDCYEKIKKTGKQIISGKEVPLQ
ncbi:hypothetical protein BOTBODRAFT_29452 [Botryobasidium botryosum FD-172 SS1]|uniref:HMA domain-containing protein n=1 Tax=Botryobasidium botryosum (strain FD-172 SS1) TaxID=930990 RepID=A0A067MQV4_BOTB1|nr:hypothetical protein BOTBODRAFT_29452 [Botryobasidium botryosum FD-172 SS1]